MFIPNWTLEQYLALGQIIWILLLYLLPAGFTGAGVVILVLGDRQELSLRERTISAACCVGIALIIRHFTDGYWSLMALGAISALPLILLDQLMDKIEQIREEKKKQRLYDTFD